MIRPTVENTDINLKNVSLNFDDTTNSWFIFKNKDSLTDYLYNKNSDHFFVGTKCVIELNDLPFSESDTTKIIQARQKDLLGTRAANGYGAVQP